MAQHHDQEAELSLFCRVQCASVLKTNKPVILDSNCTVHQAVETLATHGITAAPVYDKANDQYLRMLDLAAIISVGINFVLEGKKTKLADAQRSKVEEMLDTITIQIIPKNFPLDLSEQNPFYTLKDSDSLLDALKMLSSIGRNTVIHRVVIVDKHNNLHGILSQADIIRYTLEHIKELPSISALLPQTLEQLKLVHANKKVVTLNQSKTLSDALTMMYEKNLSGIGLVDDKDHLSGIISFSTVKHLLAKKQYNDLLKSCKSFYEGNVLHQGDHEEKEENKLYMAVYPETTLNTVLQRIRSKHVHHVFVVEDGKPVGVISLTDILRLFYEHLSS